VKRKNAKIITQKAKKRHDSSFNKKKMITFAPNFKQEDNNGTTF